MSAESTNREGECGDFTQGVEGSGSHITPWTRDSGSDNTRGMQHHTEMTDAPENSEATRRTRPCLGSEVTASLSLSAPRLSAEESSKQCGVECTSRASDHYSVCGDECEGTRHISHTVDDDYGVCGSEESVIGCANRSSVCNGVSTHEEMESSKATEACNGTAMSVTADGCTTDTQRTDLSSDVSQPDGSSADSVAGDSPESDTSVSEDGSDTAENDTANDSKESHVTAHNNDGTAEDSSSDTTHNNTNQAQDQHPLSGPHRRRQTSRQERRQPPHQHHPLRRLNLPPSVMAQWRAVGRQWGMENDDDIAHVLMRHYEDVMAGRPPRPPPHQLCPECGEILRPVPCRACGPHQHSFRLAHDSGGTSGNSSGGKGSSCCP